MFGHASQPCPKNTVKHDVFGVHPPLSKPGPSPKSQNSMHRRPNRLKNSKYGPSLLKEWATQKSHKVRDQYIYFTHFFFNILVSNFRIAANLNILVPKMAQNNEPIYLKIVWIFLQNQALSKPGPINPFPPTRTHLKFVAVGPEVYKN